MSVVKRSDGARSSLVRIRRICNMRMIVIIIVIIMTRTLQMTPVQVCFTRCAHWCAPAINFAGVAWTTTINYRGPVPLSSYRAKCKNCRPRTASDATCAAVRSAAVFVPKPSRKNSAVPRHESADRNLFGFMIPGFKFLFNVVSGLVSHSKYLKIPGGPVLLYFSSQSYIV